MTSFHQIDADISLPTSPDLMRLILTQAELVAIAEEIGQDELQRIAAVSHDHGTNPDYAALDAQEKHDLEVLRRAITTVTGKKRAWIMGYASEFALALKYCLDQ
ncbi:MAG: hypothetical protein KW802_00945 [Candidatus Doudnabacteria bacterium]|nr:hypothetical protein [Candidatus Doudnabacteria bacterium]